jgi:hypothetical protein
MTYQLVSPFGALSLPAGAANLQQFQLVALNATGQIVTPASGGAAVIGVLDDAPQIAVSTYTASNEEYSGGYTVGADYNVNIADISKVIFGGTVAAGAFVMTDTNGHAVAWTTGNAWVGQSLEAHVSGDVGPVQILKAPSNS